MEEKKQQKKKSPKKKKRDKEKLSRKDIEELMGMRIDTYTRHKGAIRRK